jgi:hypothetical protein
MAQGQLHIDGHPATLRPTISLRGLSFSVLILAALTLVPAGAHLAELPNKLRLNGPGWLAAQGMYRGWGVVLGPLELATVIVAASFVSRVRGRQPAFRLSVIALASYIAMQVCFWALTFPVNLAVANWAPTQLPPDWALYRARWEWSHAARAVLAFTALLCLTWAVLNEPRSVDRRTRTHD